MKKSLKIISLFTLMVVLILTVTSCKKDKKDTIRIASVGPISGDVAIYGNSTKKGIELAIEEINNNGGILVVPEEIRTPDTRLRRPLLYPTELLGHPKLLYYYTPFC